MEKQFTASEVRDLAKRGTDAMQQFIDGRHTLHIPPQHDDADMVIAECLRAMDAFADLLEAQEKSVPVTECGYSSTVEHRASNANVVGSNPIARSNSDAERLAEALRELVVACEEHDAMVSRIIGHPAGWNAQYLNSARQALAAHSAKAQPPAASVTDESVLVPIKDESWPPIRVIRAMLDCQEADPADGSESEAYYGLRAAMKEWQAALAAHSAQAQPPAAKATDAMQELADKYHELLWAVARKFPGETRHETALRYIREAECQEAALAAQENPNG